MSRTPECDCRCGYCGRCETIECDKCGATIKTEGDEDLCMDCAVGAPSIEVQAAEHAARCAAEGAFWISIAGWGADRIETFDHWIEKHDCVLVTATALNDGRGVVARDFVAASIFIESERERAGMSEMQKFAAHNLMGFSPESFAKRGIA